MTNKLSILLASQCNIVSVSYEKSNGEIKDRFFTLDPDYDSGLKLYIESGKRIPALPEPNLVKVWDISVGAVRIINVDTVIDGPHVLTQ